MPDYVTHEQCESYRHDINETNQKQGDTLIRLDTEVNMVQKIMWCILGVLVSGFAGTIFAVLNIN